MGLLIAAVIALAGLGLVFGLGLAYASDKCAVDTDPRIEEVAEALPGVNCGGCSYSGCSSYAEAVVTEGAAPNLCSVGGEEVAARIAEIMGVEVEQKEPEIAVVRCRGTNVADRFLYDGVWDCRAALLVQCGFKECEYGCLGLGTCVEACPFEAIRMGDDGLPEVIEERCVGCRQCEKACPRGIIAVQPKSKYVHVLCRSHDKGGAAKRICAVACIGCKKCEKVCPKDAIHVVDFLAEIDYDKCISCGKCVKECPQGCIINLRPKRRPPKKKQPAEAVA